MHELSITRNVVAIVAEKAGQRQVLRVCLEIGELSAVMPDAIRFCFPLCSRNTVLEGAELEIRTVATRLRCESCGRETAARPGARCDCGAGVMQCVAGDELKIKEMELN